MPAPLVWAERETSENQKTAALHSPIYVVLVDLRTPTPYLRKLGLTGGVQRFVG